MDYRAALLTKKKLATTKPFAAKRVPKSEVLQAEQNSSLSISRPNWNIGQHKVDRSLLSYVTKQMNKSISTRSPASVSGFVDATIESEFLSIVLRSQVQHTEIPNDVILLICGFVRHQLKNTRSEKCEEEVSDMINCDILNCRMLNYYTIGFYDVLQETYDGCGKFVALDLESWLFFSGGYSHCSCNGTYETQSINSGRGGILDHPLFPDYEKCVEHVYRGIVRRIAGQMQFINPEDCDFNLQLVQFGMIAVWLYKNFRDFPMSSQNRKGLKAAAKLISRNYSKKPPPAIPITYTIVRTEKKVKSSSNGGSASNRFAVLSSLET